MRMSSQDRKAWERQQRENRIIDLAEPVFFAKGYDGATIIEIARACGYNKRSIYLYFRDKEELFLAVVLRGLERLHLALEEAAVKEDIRTLGRAFFDFSMAFPDYLGLIMIYEAGSCVYRKGEAPLPEAGPYKLKCQEQTDATADLMAHCIEQAMMSGEIKSDLTPVQLMMVLWGQVLGVIQIILMRQEGFEDTYGISHEMLFERFMDMVTLGLSRG